VGNKVRIRRGQGSQYERGAYHSLATRVGKRPAREREREREGKGNGPCKGPSGTSRKITRHEEMKVDGRRRIRKGNIQGRKWTK
jgi:hypothetical protein